MDVVVDTDVLSTFIKINKVDLLRRVFPKSTVLVAPAVDKEIKNGVRLGILTYSQPAGFSAVKLSLPEKRLAREIREKTKLGFGEVQCIAVAKIRKCLLVTNDAEVEREADSLSIQRINLPLLLRELWKRNIMSKQQVAILIEEIQKKDRVVIKNKGLIFV